MNFGLNIYSDNFYLLLQISLAARLPRETPTSTETSFWDSAKSKISEIGDNISKTLTKENADV